MGYTVVMHIEAVPNRGSHPTILLRQSYRDGKNVRKRTLANLTCLPEEAIETLKRTLRGEKLVPCDQAFAVERSIPHGHVKAILGTIRKIGLDTIIASRLQAIAGARSGGGDDCRAPAAWPLEAGQYPTVAYHDAG